MVEEADVSKKKYNGFKWIPFKEPQPESVYQKVRRSDDPAFTAVNLNIVDKKKLKDMKRVIDRII